MPSTRAGIERLDRARDADHALPVGDDQRRAPGRCPSVPSVATNGGRCRAAPPGSRWPMPNAEPTASRGQRSRAIRAGRHQRHGEDDRRQREHRAHRQVEPLGHDDERHRQRQQQQHGRLDQDVGEIGGRGKCGVARAKRRPAARPARSPRRAGARASRAEPDRVRLSVIGACPAARYWPRSVRRARARRRCVRRA